MYVKLELSLTSMAAFGSGWYQAHFQVARDEDVDSAEFLHFQRWV